MIGFFLNVDLHLFRLSSSYKLLKLRIDFNSLGFIVEHKDFLRKSKKQELKVKMISMKAYVVNRLFLSSAIQLHSGVNY